MEPTTITAKTGQTHHRVNRQMMFLVSFILISITTKTTAVAAAKSWIDTDTPGAARTAVGMGGRTLSLVFSDEFNLNGRNFSDGADTRWTAEDRPGTTNGGLHYYNSSHVQTDNSGNLVIETTRQDATYEEHDPNGWLQTFDRNYQTGLVSTWNKFCFTSGLIEIRFQLPGDAKRGGLWPAFWMLGNLARPSYLRSTEGVWPWSYDQCGISEEGLVNENIQRVHKCTAGTGRGSPEIDIFEAHPGDLVQQYNNVEFVDGTIRNNITISRPLISASLQVSPGVVDDSTTGTAAGRPVAPNLPQPNQWYPDLYPKGGSSYGNMENNIPRMLNNNWYGMPLEEDDGGTKAWQDALTVNWQHSTDFYSEHAVLRTEWQVGDEDGYVRWFFGDELIYEITSNTLKNKPGAQDALAKIPYEAMYLILNTDVSPRWGWHGCDPNDPCMLANPGLCSANGALQCFDCSDPKCLVCPEQTSWFADFCEDIHPNRPAQFLVDYVRVYQDPNDNTHSVGCSPPDFPTREIIEQNKEQYIFDPFVQDEPLQVIQHGGGECSNDAGCGSVSKGKCVRGSCQCTDLEWTGPNCHSPCVGEYANCVTSSAPDRAGVFVALALSLLCFACR